MATFYLLNTTNVGTAKYFPGDLLDDASDPTSAIAAAGGVLWPSSDATVAAAATVVANQRKSRALNEIEMASIMSSAAASSMRLGGGAAATTTTPGTMSAADKTFLDGAHAAAGANLGDADANLLMSAGTWRKIPAATLGADRTYTLQTTGAVAGDQITVTRLDATANQAIFVNGGAGAGTLLTMPVSKVNFGTFQFDGTNWALRSCGTQ